MRKSLYFVLIAVVNAAMTGLTACSSSSSALVADSSSDKACIIQADNADKDAAVTTGSLVVEEGETIHVSWNLEKGTIRLEFFAVPEEQSIDEVPDYSNQQPDIFFDLSGTDSQGAGFNPGTYMVNITVIEKATGTVEINVA